jgi:large subunit ribosomal protein L25
MAEKITLAAEPRTAMRKETRQLRRTGKTPVVVYGRHAEPVSLQVDTKDLLRVLSQAGGSNLITLDVSGEKAVRMVVAKAIQRHITRLTPLHADFVQVQMDEMLSVAVPIIVEGEPDLVQTGDAVIEIVMDRVLVESLPGDMVDAIRVDATVLDSFDAAIRVADLVVGTKARILTDPNELVVHLRSTAVSEPAAEAVEEAPEDTGAEG